MAKKIEETLYNNEKKLQFLEPLSEAERGVAKGLFLLSAPIEEQKKTDISSFSVNEIIEFYRSCDFRSIGTIRAKHRLLKKYVYFVFGEERLDLGTITESVLESTLNQYVLKSKLVTENDLDDWERTLRKGKVWNPSMMFFIRAIYEGICGQGKQELKDLKMEDFSIVDGKYYVNIPGVYGKTIEVSKKLYDLADETNRTFEYYTVKYRNKADVIAVYELEGDNIIKLLKKDNASEENFYRKMRNRYKVIQKTLGIEHIAMTDISISGAINRIKKLADESKRDIIDYALDYENAKIIRQILRDYNRNSASSYQMLQKSIVNFFE